MDFITKVRLPGTAYANSFSVWRKCAPIIAPEAEHLPTSPVSHTINRFAQESATITAVNGENQDARSSVWSRVHQGPGRFTKWWTWLVDDSWALEYAALALAVASFASIVAVLQVYNDRPSSDWTSKLSLNTIISTIATVMKGAVLLPVGAALGQLKWSSYHGQRRPLQTFQTLDAASRGPLGAATLLYELHFWHLASLGAAVTLLALASDPFVQQAVTYPVRQSNATAFIPFAQDYILTGQPSTVEGYQVEQSMKAAIYDAVMFSNLSETSAVMSAQCSTGNCTFPEYASLAVCAKCVDVTSMIERICVPVNQSLYDSGFAPPCFERPELPNGLQLANGDAYWYTSNRGYNILNMTSSIRPMGRYDLNSNELKDILNMSFGQVSMLIANVTDHVENPNISMQALENTLGYDCVFQFCIQTYTGHVSNGVLTETIGKQYTPDPKGDFSNYEEIHLPPGHLPSDANLTFSVSNATAQALRLHFHYTFQGQGTGFRENGPMGFSADIMDALFNNGPDKIPESMRNIATSMTNNMRLKSKTKMQGTALSFQPYIRVRWLWLLLPMLMIVGAALFLLLTVWQSRTWGVPPWRSSALAVMVHGINGAGSGDVERECATDLMALNDAIWAGKEKVSQLDRWAEEVEVTSTRRGRMGLSYGLVQWAATSPPPRLQVPRPRQNLRRNCVSS